MVGLRFLGFWCQRFHRRNGRHSFRFQRFSFQDFRIFLNEWPPLPPDDGIKLVHISAFQFLLSAFPLDRVHTNRDLFPVCAVADRETRHGASATGGQVDDATGEFRRRDTSGHRGRDVGKSRRLNLFTRTDPLKTARNIFAHKIMFG